MSFTLTSTSTIPALYTHEIDCDLDPANVNDDEFINSQPHLNVADYIISY